MSRSSLSEQIYRILPGEQNKRIREAILAAAGYGGQRSNQVRKTIEEPNRLKTGLLTAGTVEFTSTTSADLDLFSWVIDYQISQPGPLTLAVFAPHASVARPDYFIGKDDGSIDYRAGIVDSQGNVSFPNVAADEVLLRSVLRKADGTNIETPTEPDQGLPDHNATKNIQGGKPAIGSDPAEYYHILLQELLKLRKLIANVSANSVSQRGLTTFTSPTSADSTNWKWIVNDVEFSVISETNATMSTPAVYPVPDFFIGLTDGTIDYRPGLIDNFGNPVLPDIADDEVVLDIVIRDPDGNNYPIPPDEYFQAPFPNYLYQTAVQAGTTGLYAKVWGAALVENSSYGLILEYMMPSSDWATSPGRVGEVRLGFFCLGGTVITDIQFETVDGNSEPGDWALIRVGDQVSLYHKSTDYWMRCYYRVTLPAGGANKTQIFNRQTYAALPSGDQLYESTPYLRNEIDELTTDLTDLENQVQDIETEVDDHETRIADLEASPGGGGGHEIQSAGTPLAQRAALNFSEQFTVSDDSGGDKTGVSIDENVMATRDYVNSGATTANAASRLYLFNNY